MVVDTITTLMQSGGMPLLGGGLLGVAVGYALKKIAKFVIIGLGLMAPGISGISEMDIC